MDSLKASCLDISGNSKTLQYGKTERDIKNQLKPNKMLELTRTLNTEGAPRAVEIDIELDFLYGYGINEKEAINCLKENVSYLISQLQGIDYSKIIDK